MISVDPLEQTQDVDASWCADGWRPNGVWRNAWDGNGWNRAPELSERYPSVHIDMTRRQAC